ncbi:hypothetical protein GSI_03905 [Ganoderma sinense ZZ0214-1]|uniref:Uncharacterized protein n=1 Tax=Ganoderma sinense ZZ0214-1 TaxID=1077348 RepID=A0A2G8SK94_9APHY|nr:hypothetical protein GSI_03905 [Ganoderma sinense ZZ0214-1]
MDGHKRKRDDDGTVVTFYAPDRTFARVYKGQSLEETKDLVRRKLGLSEDTSLRFARLHEGKVIELDDDEDFEAFRHIARYVSTLDVSVFIGQNGPSIFSQQSSQESTTNPKRGKNRRAKVPIVPVSSEAATRGVMSRKDQMSGGLDAITSTLDANGLPKKKRKRKGMSPSGESAVSALVLAENAPQATPEGHEAPGSVKNHLPHILSTVPSPPATQEMVLFSAGTPGVSKSSKRKRQDTPESPAAPGSAARTVASSSIPSQPSSPSSPVKKKRRKEERPEDAGPSLSIEKQTIARSDKKGRHTANDTVSTPSKVASAPDTEDAAAIREVAKRAKKEARAKERQLAEAREEAVSSKEGGERSKKRKPVEEAQVTDVEPSVSQIPSETKLASKKDKQRKHIQAPTESQTAVVPVPGAPTGDKPAKGGKERKAKIKSRQSEHLTVEPVGDLDEVEPAGGSLAIVQVEADGEPKGTGAWYNKMTGVDITDTAGKKSRRRKTSQLPADAERADHPADLPVAASTESVAIPGIDDGSNSASIKKPKGNRKKSLPIVDSSSSREPAETTPSAAMSIIQAAVQAVLARASSASAGPVPVPSSQQPTSLTPEPALPTRKGKAGKSKLSQTWGPNDLVEEQEQVSASAAICAPTSAAPVSSAVPALEIKKVSAKEALRPSDVPTCPICDKASLHPRPQCPIIEAGPVAIRKRIAEIKKSGGSEELVDELDVLLKEAQRRGKSVGEKRASEVSKPVSISALEVPVRATPSSLDVPLHSISTSSQARPSLGERSLSSPRLPAGSEISEVVVQSRDEGSSNESSSDDEDDEDEGAPPSSFLALSSSLSLLNPDNLEALLYGPVKPRTSILTQIPSSSSSSSDGEESDDEVEKDEDVDMDEDEKNDRAFRRISRKFARTVSSSDEGEPQPEPDLQQDRDGAEVDGDEPLVPPPQTGPDSNRSMDTEDAQQVEAAVLDQKASAVEWSIALSREGSPVSPDNGGDASEGEERIVNKGDVQSEVESDEEVEPVTVPQPDDQSNETKADESDASPATRGDDHSVDPGAEVDPLASQEHPQVPIEVSEGPQGPEGVAAVDEEPEQSLDEGDHAEMSLELANSSRKPEPKLQVDLPHDHASYDDDPEMAASPAEASANLSGTTAQAELEKVTAPLEGQDANQVTAESYPDTMEVEVFEPHAEDPDDPIETFGSDHDQEQRDVLEEDPIEDPDMTQQGQRTPPPATPRTPGTVRRMKDRYGRLSQARNHQASPRLSQQLLGDLVLSQEEITLASPPTGGALEPSLELEAAPDVQTEVNGDMEAEKEAEVVEPARTQETAPSQSQREQADETVEARPRRTARTTARRTSSTAPSSSLPEPPATSMPAPAPRRRGGRLTAEEKAQREAEKAQKDAEKKAERERKAAEKAAEKAAKEAQKKAERERKAAERQAVKDSKQAEKEAKQKEKAPAKRGRVARGRGGSTKPISTRSQQVVESAEPERDADEPELGEENGEKAFAQATVTETPGVARVSWAVLPQSESRTQEGSVGETSMIDELQPSSPEAAPPHQLDESLAFEDPVDQEPIEDQVNLPMVTPKPKGKKNDPLFIPSSSQRPVTPFGLPNAESTPFANGDGQHEGDSDPDGEPDRTFKAPTRPRSSWISQSLYPSLTDLASQSLFSATQIPSPALYSQTPKQGTSYGPSPATYGKGHDDDEDDDDDDSSDSSDSSDSDGGKKKSYIPQNRRAGAGVQKKKKSGLLSVYG